MHLRNDWVNHTLSKLKYRNENKHNLIYLRDYFLIINVWHSPFICSAKLRILPLAKDTKQLLEFMTITLVHYEQFVYNYHAWPSLELTSWPSKLTGPVHLYHYKTEIDSHCISILVLAARNYASSLIDKVNKYVPLHLHCTVPY